MKKLYLSNDKQLSGLCAGIGEYYGVDANLVRLAWIVGTVLTGFVPGVLGYIVASMVIPRNPTIDASGK